MTDGETYFFFNEGNQVVTADFKLAGSGTAELWDPLSGGRERLRAGNLRLEFGPYESKLIVLALHSEAPIRKEQRDQLLQELTGEWQLDLDGRRMQTVLRNWSDLGSPGFWGTARYQKNFVFSGIGDLVLDLGEVRYAARVWLNGTDLGGKAWRPYRWDLAKRAKAGSNELVVEVSNTRANELAADPKRYDEIEKKGWLVNSYVRTYLKFDREMTPSGLVGPVRLLARK